MTIHQLLDELLRDPSPDVLWRLHPQLLTRDTPAANAARTLAGEFFSYLSGVQSKLTSKQYSSLAALLEAGAVGLLAGKDIVEALSTGGQQAITELLTGGLASLLETFSTAQHVKAWETEFTSTNNATLWTLYAEMWHISVDMQPDLSIEKRRALVDELFAPARDMNLVQPARTALIIRLFQLLLSIRLIPLLEAEPEPAP